MNDSHCIRFDFNEVVHIQILWFCFIAIVENEDEVRNTHFRTHLQWPLKGENLMVFPFLFIFFFKFMLLLYLSVILSHVTY